MNKSMAAEKLSQLLTLCTKYLRFIYVFCLVSVKLTGCGFHGIA